MSTAPSFVTANGVKFAYLEQGTGPLVLLVHGFPDTAHTWDAAMPAIAAVGFRAVAPFTRGYHPTEVPADGKYDTDTLGADLVALIDALGETSAIVVGHDWGASAAYAAAALAPERIRLLVTLAIPHPAAIRPTPLLMWKMRHMIELRSAKAADRVRANDFAYLDTLWRRWSPAWAAVPLTETAAAKEAFQQPGCLEAALGYYREMMSNELRNSELQSLFDQRFTTPAVPLLYLHGDSCGCVPLSSVGDPLPYLAPGSRFEVVKGVGHFLHLERPDETADSA